MLKVGRATTRGRAAAGRRVARRKEEVAGPRTTIRRRDIFLGSDVAACFFAQQDGWRGSAGGVWEENDGLGVTQKDTAFRVEWIAVCLMVCEYCK